MLAASILSPQFIAGVIIVIVILCIIGSCIRIVPQAHAVIVERLGGYLTTWSVGVHIKMPFVDHVARNVILKEAKADAAVLQIKSMEAFEKAADGKATKIIVPSNLASIAGTLTALSETVQKDAPES